MNLEEMFEENVKYLEEKERLANEILKAEADYMTKVSSLKKQKEDLEKNYNIINSSGGETYNKFYKMVSSFFGNEELKAIKLDCKKEDFIKISSYEFFKQKLEEYAGENLVLVNVTTPIKKAIKKEISEPRGYSELYDFYPKDIILTYETRIDDLLVPFSVLKELYSKITLLTEKEYNKILNLKNVFMLGSLFLDADMGQEVQRIDENKATFSLYLNKFNNQNKSIIELPLNPNYNKELEKVLFDTLVYTLKIKKLKEIKTETENAEDIARKIKKDEEFIKFLDK